MMGDDSRLYKKDNKGSEKIMADRIQFFRPALAGLIAAAGAALALGLSASDAQASVGSASAGDGTTIEWASYAHSNTYQYIDSDGYYRYGPDKKKDTTKTGGVYKQTSTGNWYYVSKGKIGTTSSSSTWLGANWNGFWFLSGNDDGQIQADLDQGDIAKVTAAGNFNYIPPSGTGWYSFGGDEVEGTSASEVQLYLNGTVGKNSNGWWYLSDGKVDFSYSGFAANKNGYWWIGKVDSVYEISKAWDRSGEIDVESGGDAGSELDFGSLDGYVNFDAFALAKDTEGVISSDTSLWYFVSAGKVDFSFTGFVKNSNGWWYVENGVVDFAQTGLYGPDANGNWYYFSGNKVDFTYTGMAANTYTYDKYYNSPNENNADRYRYWGHDLTGVTAFSGGSLNLHTGFSSSGNSSNTAGLRYSWYSSNKKTYWWVDSGVVNFDAYGAAYYNGYYWLVLRGLVWHIDTKAYIGGTAYTVDEGIVKSYSGGNYWFGY